MYNSIVLLMQIGDQPGMLDYMIWPWMERVPAFSIVTKGLVNNPLENFPKLV